MEARQLSQNDMEDYGAKQRTISDVLAGADVRISTIYSVVKALGIMDPSVLFRERDAMPQNRNVSSFPAQPSIIPDSKATAKSSDRKTKRR